MKLEWVVVGCAPYHPIIRTITWLAIFEYNYHPRIYSCNEDVTILQVGDSELGFNHAPGAFNSWWQSGRRNVGMRTMRGRKGWRPGG